MTLATPAPPPPPQTTGLRAKPRTKRDGRFAVRSHSPQSRDRGTVMLLLTGAALCAIAAFVPLFFRLDVPIFAASAFGVCMLLMVLTLRRARKALPEHADELSERFEALAQRMENMEGAGWATRESEDIHRSLTEAFGDVVVHRNANGTVTFINNIARALFAGSVPMPAVDDTAAKDGRTRIVRVQTPTGEKVFRWGDLASNDPVTGEPGTRSFGRDITAERRDRAALETALHEVRAASHERDRVLAMVGHDLRAPAANIVGLADWLADTDLTPAQTDHVDTIRAAARQQLDLVDDVLTEAAANRSNTALRPEPVDLRVLVEGVARTLAPRANRLAFTTRVAPDVATTVMLDGARLRQVLLNLAGNAVKFTQTGGVAIEVRASDKGIALSVTDSGPGIPASERDTIFHDFVRSETAKGTEGNGLGLAIAKDWVEAMGGSLRLADSEAGTCFEAFVPVSHATRKAPLPNRRGTIGLAMHDHPARHALAAVLQDLGYSVLIIDTEAQVAECGCVIGNDLALANRAVPRIVMQNGEDGTTARHWLKWPIRPATLDTIVMAACGGDVARSRYRILLVEDDPIASTLTRRALLAAGHKVSAVETLAAGRSALSAATFDAVLIDGTLPDGDGIAFIADQTAAGHADAKLVLLSADTSAERTALAMAAGADGVVAKPLDMNRLDLMLGSGGTAEPVAADTAKPRPLLQLVAG